MAVGNDTFGYIAGVLWGKHPMAPRISPKKTWEGFAGSMVGSMVQIARQLGLRTVAEFVESAAAQDCLRELGIDYAQGYFIGRPHPLAELADALAAEPLLPR